VIVVVGFGVSQFLIRLSCSSKTLKIQVDLFNTELKANSWWVLGFVGASLLDLDAGIWTVELTSGKIDSCSAEWEIVKHYE